MRVAESGEGPYGQIVFTGRHLLSADEPVNLGGRDTGPDPYQLVLAGLGACTAMTIRMYAERHDWPLARVEVRARHIRSVGSDNTMSDRFERTVELTGDLDAEQRRRLIEIADRCPVSQTLQRGAEVTATAAAEGVVQ